MEYSIKDLEKISGIQAHTIRIWEQRYSLLLPNRSDTNIRSYSSYYARKLLNVVTLVENGWKISKVAKLSHDEINSEIQTVIQSIDVGDHFDNAIVNRIIESGVAMSESIFEKAFSSALLKYGIRDSYLKVIYPTLVKIGLMWSKSEMIPVQEHFITNMIKQKLFAAIDALPYPESKADRWVLFLPPGENHEMGLLMSHYILKEKGYNVVYLGNNVPLEDIEGLLAADRVNSLLMFAVARETVLNAGEIASSILSFAGDTKLWLAGSFEDKSIFADASKLNFVENFNEFIKQS